MTRDEMIFLMRQHLSDEQAVGWQNDSELIAFADRASDYLSEKLIADKDPVMMKTLVVDGLTKLPEGFAAFVGRVPVRVLGWECEGYGGAVFEAAYWARLPYPSAFRGCDELPYTREQALLMANLAVVFAQNKNEFDVSQDMALIGELNKAISMTRGGR